MSNPSSAEIETAVTKLLGHQWAPPRKNKTLEICRICGIGRGEWSKDGILNYYHVDPEYKYLGSIEPLCTGEKL